MEKEFSCSVCLDLADDAVETSCCHHVFCESCLSSLDGEPCPHCRQEFAIQVSHVVRRIIGNMSTQCPNKSCRIKLTRSELKKHAENCKFRTFSCPVINCKFIGAKEPFAQHLFDSHQDDIVDNAKDYFAAGDSSKVGKDRIAMTQNEFGRHARLGSTGKFYCERRLHLRCTCCNGFCGPTNGCNCRACMKLDVKLRKLPPNWYVNREGAACRRSSETNLFYCGRCVMDDYDDNCDGYCGPRNGPNCRSCQILQDQVDTRYSEVW